MTVQKGLFVMPELFVQKRDYAGNMWLLFLYLYYVCMWHFSQRFLKMITVFTGFDLKSRWDLWFENCNACPRNDCCVCVTWLHYIWLEISGWGNIEHSSTIMCVTLAHHILPCDWYNSSLATIPYPEWIKDVKMEYIFVFVFVFCFFVFSFFLELNTSHFCDVKYLIQIQCFGQETFLMKVSWPKCWICIKYFTLQKKTCIPVLHLLITSLSCNVTWNSFYFSPVPEWLFVLCCTWLTPPSRQMWLHCSFLCKRNFSLDYVVLFTHLFFFFK